MNAAEIDGRSLSQAEFYRRMVSAGVAPRLAEMLAARSAPRVNTDSVYFSGRGTLADQFSGAEEQLDYVVNEARKRGYEPNPNDVYEPALAKCIGDPAAFVSPSGGRGQIQKVCERRGMACSGAVNVKARPSDPKPDVPIADDIVQRLTPGVIAKDPKLALASTQEIRAEVVRQHGFKQ